MLSNYKVILMYDGTDYAGFQIQNQSSVRTVQGELERAFSTVARQKTEIIGVSRTDSGVHAAEYVVNCRLDIDFEAERLKKSVNALLDDDIRVISIEPCAEDFHARRCSKGKTYLYRIDNSDFGNVFIKKYCWHYSYPLNIEEMKRAACEFEGTYDFSAFMSAGGCSISTVKTIYDVSVGKNESMIEIRVTGSAFLYNMVRIMVGTLLEVGRGKKRSSEIKEIILSGERKNAGITAPPQGLTLERVYY